MGNIFYYIINIEVLTIISILYLSQHKCITIMGGTIRYRMVTSGCLPFLVLNPLFEYIRIFGTSHFSSEYLLHLCSPSIIIVIVLLIELLGGISGVISIFIIVIAIKIYFQLHKNP
jgi:hypothetical protein